jgi:hypothetical protein
MPRLSGMDLKDSALMLASESAAHPTVASIARAAYDQLAQGQPVDYRLLNDLLGEASGKGVLRALHAKYSPAACEAIIMPICQEIGRQAPIRPRRRAAAPPGSADDPLTAPVWPPR